MRQFRRSDDGRIGNFHAVVQLVFFLQATQDSNGRLHTGLVDQDLLKTPLQSRVFFHVLPVFVQGSGAHAVQFASGQGRFKHVARVHRALGFTGADHGVNFIDK